MDERMEQLGFKQVFDVEGRYTVAELLPKSKPRCGIYLLEFSDNLCYIGQTTDVVRRFTQHRNRYNDIVRLYFKPVYKRLLLQDEKSTIFMADSIGIPLVNRDHVSGIVGEADLDTIISPDEQEEWLDDPTKHQNTTFRIENASLRASHTKQFQVFQRRSDHQHIIKILRHYIRNTVPAYRKTEAVFWSLSCIPSTFASTSPRLSCCSINTMETFVIGHHLGIPNKIGGFVVVSQDELASAYSSDEVFYQKYPNTSLEYIGYKAAGPDQITIFIEGIRQLEAVMEDEAILRAARLLNLRVMLKGATMHWPAHCLDLADHIV